MFRESEDTILQLVALKFKPRITIPEEVNEAASSGARNRISLDREKEQANGAETNAEAHPDELEEFAETAVEVSEWIARDLPVQGEVMEMRFDIDRRGQFHLLFASLNRELYYCCQEHAPRCIAQGETRYFPYVAVSSDVWLGFANTYKGYRFIRLDVRQYSPEMRSSGADVSSGGFER